MYQVLSCLRDQHDHRLVLLAVLICALATYTAFHIYSSARQSQGSKRLGWSFSLASRLARGSGDAFRRHARLQDRPSDRL
jgi:NO-binding membrane sensor protein with MHYT domain